MDDFLSRTLNAKLSLSVQSIHSKREENMKFTNGMRAELVDTLAKRLYAKQIEEAEKALSAAGTVIKNEILRRVGVRVAFKSLPEHWFDQRSSFFVMIDEKSVNVKCEYGPLWHGSWCWARNHKGEVVVLSNDDPCVVAYLTANDTLRKLEEEYENFRKELTSSLASITTDTALKKQMPHVWEVFNELFPKTEAGAGLPTIRYQELDNKIAGALNKLVKAA